MYKIELVTYFLLFFTVPYLVNENILNQSNSFLYKEFIYYLISISIFTKLYTFYLEFCYFHFPKYRTQKNNKNIVKEKDINGRTKQENLLIQKHNLYTFFSQLLFNISIYYLIPGYYPFYDKPYKSIILQYYSNKNLLFIEKFIKLLLNHYIMSYGMYWLHRAFHQNKFLWNKIHKLHHFASTPLSRNTYEDHWLDNLGASIVGHFFAQIICPLDYHFFIFSHYFRIMESLEKHSGINCFLNIAHFLQSWLPYVQMPYHHDLHHQRFKRCNYTFSSIGGIWDVIFETRKTKKTILQQQKSFFDDEYLVFLPLMIYPILFWITK